MIWNLVVWCVVFGPLLLAALLQVLSRVVVWVPARCATRCLPVLWRHSCWLLPCVQLWLLMTLEQVLVGGIFIARTRSLQTSEAWCTVGSQSNEVLHVLFSAGKPREDFSPEEELRRIVRERLTLFFGDSVGGHRERSRQLLAFRERFAGAGPISEAVSERMSLAEEGWAAGDFRNSGLLYAVVCDQLEQELRQWPLRDNATASFARLVPLVCEQGADVSDSVAESASAAGQLESALRVLSELGSEHEQLVLEIASRSGEYQAVTARLGGESDRECELQLELDQLLVEREQLRQRRVRLEQLWARRGH